MTLLSQISVYRDMETHYLPSQRLQICVRKLEVHKKTEKDFKN